MVCYIQRGFFLACLLGLSACTTTSSISIPSPIHCQRLAKERICHIDGSCETVRTLKSSCE